MTYLEIADHFEHEINSRKLVFDQRLPSTKELAKQFGVTDPTIQRCMTRLVEKGLLYRVPKRGTFVRRNTNIGGKIAFVFGKNPFTGESRFPGLYLSALEEYTAKRQIPAKVYYILNDSMLADVVKSLEYDAEHEGIRCAVAIHSTDPLNAYLASQNLFPGTWTPSFDYGVMLKEGIARLHQNGCQKIDVLYARSKYDYYRNATADLWGTVKMACDEQGISESQCEIRLLDPSRQSGAEYMEEIFSRKSHERPDGVLSCDETLTQGMMSVLWRNNVKLPTDLRLITQMTKGDTIISPVKLAAFECDPAKMASTMLDFIFSSKNGLKVGFNDIRTWVEPEFVGGESL